MKRLYFCIILVLIMAIGGVSEAKVAGVCSKCHTMHNSQGGEAMAYGLKSDLSGFEPDTTPNPTLLITDCVGCHTNVGNTTIIDDEFPIVFNTVSPSKPLAGGNFRHVTTDHAKGHNVQGITDPDPTFQGKKIPGSNTDYYHLACGGEYGCHGDRNTEDELHAIKGAHHADDSGGIDGTSVGLSYRFLDGILGVEDDDWEQDNQQDPPTGNHNWYQGATGFDDHASISYLCGQCHGNTEAGGFHNSTGVGSSSPWLRHPTDILLPTTGEYDGYPTYSMVAPVAYIHPASPTREEAVVMCLSCHRAHGSQYDAIVRWDHKNSDLSIALEGCSKCHTSKN